MGVLTGKIALVTGTASGIGRAGACALAAAGAIVVAAGLDPDGGDETVAMIRAEGGEAIFQYADVIDFGSVDALVAGIVSRFGRLDCAHNNAGIESPIAPIDEIAEPDWDRSIAVNLKGAWLCLRAELRQMRRQGSGSIVNTSSVGGLTAVPGNASYAAAKHGVIGLTRTAAVEYARAGIRVNALCPGLTRTPMTDRLFVQAPDVAQTLLPPMGRMAEASEMAGMVVFLFSDAASYVTGQALTVDGGATAI